MHRRLLEHLTTAVMTLDGTFNVDWMNPAAEALLAVSLGRVKGLRLESLIGGNTAVTEVLVKAMKTAHSFTQREARLVLVSGEAVTVDFTATPLSDDELLLEIEPRDRLLRISREEALIARQKTVKVLSRGLAHEIKNPLGGIRGAAQLLERDLPDSALVEYTQVIIEEVDRLRDLVDRMLGPHYPCRHESLNIHKVVERVRTLLLAEHAGIDYVRDYDPSLPEMIGDEAQLIQALLNVAGNAVQAMESSRCEAPRLTLRTRARRQFTLGSECHRLVCEITVIDNGPGVPERLRDTLFYPMVSGRADGSGLGLAIAQSILQQHHGLIESESQSGHTEFRLLIPLDAAVNSLVEAP
ncbi:nitrogen regulation protein NR(II) [Halomonas sp. M20]|uniref:nitrogen regulation protein NR(II) n=1 Tax=Halomonas sp. M20 TaxID=2763264 RepID=UPI001D09C130|nr:nitrogen regulation protein NR(II) [Halomonas sp. M20]